MRVRNQDAISDASTGGANSVFTPPLPAQSVTTRIFAHPGTCAIFAWLLIPRRALDASVTWNRFERRALLLPTAAGMFLFLDQWRTGSPDSPLLPIFCVLIVVWTALFLDLWRRRNSEISFKWGVEGIEDEELMRVSAETRKVCVCVCTQLVQSSRKDASEGRKDYFRLQKQRMSSA